MRMIDPPNGWMYGFPKKFDGHEGQSINDWLLANGYPQHELRKFPNGVPCRIWSRNSDTGQ